MQLELLVANEHVAHHEQVVHSPGHVGPRRHPGVRLEPRRSPVRSSSTPWRVPSVCVFFRDVDSRRILPVLAFGRFGEERRQVRRQLQERRQQRRQQRPNHHHHDPVFDRNE